MTSNLIVRVDGTDVDFTLGEKISDGGQGEVFRVVDHPNFAIKILNRHEDESRIAFVSRLDLGDLSIALPIAIVRDEIRVGYLMNLAEDMETLSGSNIRRWDFVDPTIDLSETDTESYLNLGGLRRRLGIAANVASTLASLHSQSLIYMDLQPNNVMVSSDIRQSATWLIDTDNLTFASKVDRKAYTYGYAAPELLASGMPTSLSDAHSLAVLVFELLTLTHPLSGLASSELSAENWRAAVRRSEVPYVFDPNDETNRLPPKRQTFSKTQLSRELQKIALQTFTEGLLRPEIRPGVIRWRDVLFSALDNVVSCSSGCGWTFYRTAAAPYICPECRELSPDSTLLLIYPKGVEVTHAYRTMVIRDDTQNDILPRHLWGDYSDTEPVLTVNSDGETYQIEVHGEVVLTDDQTGERVTQGTSRRGHEGRLLLVKAPNQPDRIIKFKAVDSR